MLADVSVQYDISVKVIRDEEIVFSLDGTLSCQDNEKLDKAFSYAKSDMKHVADQLISQTKKELGKHNLPHSYKIKVNTGKISRCY